MSVFSNKSAGRLAGCHPDLQAVMNEAIKTVDFTVLCGHRGEAAQNEAFRRGNSKVRFPNSKHNANPSLAVDIAPYPIDWEDTGRFKALAERVLAIADHMGIELEWGGNWTSLVDMPHYQIREVKGGKENTRS